MFKVMATITEIRGEGVCHLGHKAGDSFEFGPLAPSGLCHFAQAALQPAVSILMYGGDFPWAGGRPTRWACPDPERPVVFELTRVPVSPEI